MRHAAEKGAPLLRASLQVAAMGLGQQAAAVADAAGGQALPQARHGLRGQTAAVAHTLPCRGQAHRLGLRAAAAGIIGGMCLDWGAFGTVENFHDFMKAIEANGVAAME
eukprot:2294975-Lingulodinium_polyedra.AAC.1